MLDKSRAEDVAASIPELLNLYLTKPLQMANPPRTIQLSQVLNNSDPVNERYGAHWFKHILLLNTKTLGLRCSLLLSWLRDKF